MVTSTLAVLTQRKGKQTAILDADITGPSIPKAFGMKEKAYGTELGMMPCKTKTGIDVMSVNLLLDNETDPVVWRGPVIAETVKQFWRDVVWENEEYMFIDMPPGTGDVPLTVFQSIAIDGISLTVAEVGESWFSISAIPHTVAVTTLGEKRPGDTVNLENDVIGKYVEKLLRPQPQETAKSSLTLEFLAQHGF